MYICKNCGAKFENECAFCKYCGGAVECEPVQEVLEVPSVAEDATEVLEAKVVKPDKGARVMAIVGMGMGIEGAVGIILTFIYGIMGFVVPGISIVNILFIILFGGGSVAAMILSAKAARYGDQSGFCKAAKILGLVGVICHGIALFFSFIGMFTSCSFLDYLDYLDY